MLPSRRWLLVPWALVGLAVAAVFAALDPVGDPFSGFLGYAVVALIGVGLLAATQSRLLRVSPPIGVLVALVVAMALRLVVGLGLYSSLPIVGYDTKVQEAGYVYYDAYTRDTDAYARGRSEQSLLAAFFDRRSSDQYGGLLFISSAVYRHISGGLHRALLIVMLSSIVSSLAVLYTWGFVGMTLGRRAGVLAAWIVSLYPDYVLLGSSQMREAFVVPALALALYGYARARLGDSQRARWLIAIGIAIATFISPPLGLLSLGLLVAIWAIEARLMPLASRWLILGMGLALALALALTVWAWSSVSEGSGGALDFLGRWLVGVPRFQLQLLEEQSGWVQKMFEVTPDWLHMPMAIFYGVTQPFLPAALADNSGAPIWRVIAVWRAIGWYLLLPALVFAPFAVARARYRRRLLLAMSLVIWLGILVGSYWAAGDLWDNPRYRASLLPLAAALAAWGIVQARRSGNPWLKRVYYLTLGWSGLFLHWYIGRYYGTPRLDLFVTLAAGILLTFAYFFRIWLLRRRGIAGSA